MKKSLLLISFFVALIFCFSLSALGTGATMELKVEINNFRVPERAAMAVAPGYPNTEVTIGGGQLTVLDSVGSFITSKTLDSTTKESGTITITTGTAVVGSGTNFTALFSPGDLIFANNEIHTITSVTNATHLTTSDAWVRSASGLSYSKAVNPPDSIVQQGSIARFSFPYYNYRAPYHVYLELSPNTSSANTQGSVCAANCTPIPINSNWYISKELFAYNPPSWYAGSYGTSGLACPPASCNNDYRDYIALDPANMVYEGSAGWWWRSPAIFQVN